MCTRSVLFSFAFMLSSAGLSVSAQPAQVDARAARIGQTTAIVTTRWNADGSGEGRLTMGRGRSTSLYDGGGGSATVATGHGAFLVAYARDSARRPFGARLVIREGAEFSVGNALEIARPNQRRDLPYAVVATATPTGFTIFFQEVQENDPSAAHTYMVRLDREGAQVGETVEVAVPWSLADVIWNGNGYHLALIYPGAMNGMRLSMVSTSPEGQPQQHPDWASAAGLVTDVHLAKAGDRILAFYRGAGGGRIFESDVTQIRSWGSEPPAAREHGAIRQGEAIVIERRGDEGVRAAKARVAR